MDPSTTKAAFAVLSWYVISYSCMLLLLLLYNKALYLSFSICVYHYYINIDIVDIGVHIIVMVSFMIPKNYLIKNHVVGHSLALLSISYQCV